MFPLWTQACFHFIQHNQHFTYTMTVTLIDPISFSKALKLLYCIYSHWFNGHELYIVLNGILEITFCFLHTDLICYSSSGVHCWNASAHKEPDTEWTLNRYLLNKRMMHEWKSKYICRLSYGWQTGRANIKSWPSSTIRHSVVDFFTYCRNIDYHLSVIKQMYSFPKLSIYRLIFTNWAV